MTGGSSGATAGLRPDPSPGGPALEVEGLRRSFGTVHALDGADLRVAPGSIHGLLGENGAGKTTLVRIVAGFDAPDGGTIRLRGAPVRFRNPREAGAAGIGLVHQHFTLVPRLTVLENIVLGARRRRGGPVDPGSGADGGAGSSGRGLVRRLRRWSAPPWEAARARIEELRARTGLEVDLDAPVETLGVGARQRVEILKLLHRDPEVLLLDEPTAVLVPQEVEGLFEIVRALAREGRTIVLIAHKLDEVLSVAEEVTVLRRGRTVLEAPVAEVDASALARAMVGGGVASTSAGARLAGPGDPGHEVGAPGPAAGAAARESAATAAEVVARLLRVELRGPRGESVLRGVDLEIGRGEIVGIAGVEGNGQRELALLLAGVVEPDRGEALRPDRIGLVPQDRTHEGLIPDFDLVANVGLAHHDDPPFRRGSTIRWTAMRERTERILERYGVQATGPGARAGTLSGGNQQKLVVGRELERGGALVVAENPTRGLDVAAAREIRTTLAGLDAGTLLISTDLDEVLELADRIFVIVRGRLIPVPEEERSREGLGSLMLSAREGGTPSGDAQRVPDADPDPGSSARGREGR